jgi:hypothetical protein
MFVFKKYDRQNHVWSFKTKYLRFLCKFTSWSCGCIEKQIRCWKNCWYSYNIDKCNKILCLSSRNMIDKTMCEVLWRNIPDFYGNLRVEVGKFYVRILKIFYSETTDKFTLAMYFYLYKKINYTKCLLQSRLVLTNNVQKNIYTVNLHC